MDNFTFLGQELNGGYVLMFLFLSLVSFGANWRLFLKCSQPGWAVFVPGYNVVIAMRIIGRPDKHALLFLIPGYNVYFVLRTMIELAQSFGKRTNLDYSLVMIFNVFYMLNLGLAYQEEYQGPSYVPLPSNKDSLSKGLSPA
ncbi:MAG: DUF5684 domain-containing protein [Flavobacteriales bacterium]|nr:DUF5684 domain-containing protein [Flavobacteriales bacterium]